MPSYRCPICGKRLTKAEYERALKIHEAREEHLRQLKEHLRRRERELPKKSRKQGGKLSSKRRKEPSV